MRILFVETVAQLGGAQRSLLELAECLARTPELELCAATPDGPLADGLRQAGVQTYRLPQVRLHRGLFTFLPEALRMARRGAALRDIVHRLRPDLLHANNMTAAMLALRAAENAPTIWHARDLALPAPLVWALGGRVAAIVAISEAVEERLCQMVAPFHRGRIRLIRNGIDTRRFVPRKRLAARRALGLPEAPPIVGMAAHLAPWKRHDRFIEIAAALRAARPDAHFAVAGRDLFGEQRRWRARLEAGIAARGLADVWHWAPPLDDLTAWLPALDVLAHPAVGEPFGRVVCEAMACERPVVAADAGGPSTIIPNDVGGFLAPAERLDLFAARLRQLLDDPEKARRMGTAARAHVTQFFDVTRVAEETHRLYADIAAQRARERAIQSMYADDAARRRARDADE